MHPPDVQQTVLFNREAYLSPHVRARKKRQQRELSGQQVASEGLGKMLYSLLFRVQHERSERQRSLEGVQSTLRLLRVNI